MAALGLTQAELGDALGVQQGFITQLVRGLKPLPHKYAVPLARALKIPRASPAFLDLRQAIDASVAHSPKRGREYLVALEQRVAELEGLVVALQDELAKCRAGL